MNKIPVIRVENVSKYYPRVQRQPSLRQDFGRWLGRVWRGETLETDMKVSLDDISFSVGAGEGLALIGRNGAGKSTLLRILCGISQPNVGYVDVGEPFMAVLSPQAGFMGMRSGFENIYLLGTMYGVMPRRIDQLLDAIIDFAELREVIYEPVDHYSSGMRARLAFSIVIHMAPKLLFVDEVLAVGDGRFQEKCLDAIQRLQADGCTIVVASHSMDTIRRICQRAIWLEDGHMVAYGLIEEVIERYETYIGAR